MEQKELQAINSSNNLPVVDHENSMNNFIAQAACNPNMDMDKFERLIQMKQEQEERQAKQEFQAAFAKMQIDLPEIEHNKKGHNYTYATFDSINAMVKPVMQRHGFGLMFNVSQDSNLKVTGILMHEAGYSMTTSMSLPLDKSGSKNDVQAVGSSTSYGKRYVLCALLNIATAGEDDDGTYNAKRITAAQRLILEKALFELPEEKQKAFYTKYGEAGNVRKGEFQNILAHIESMANEAKDVNS